MPQFPAVWINGERASSLPLPDRGLDFGDGLFETLLVHNGQPLLLDYHLDRLQHGLQRLAFPPCLERARQCLLGASAELAVLPWAALRITVSRGAGPRGYAPPAQVQERIVASAAPLAEDRGQAPAPARLEFARMPWSLQPALAGIKHLNRLEQVLAAAEAAELGCDEVVMLDTTGRACSVSAGNLFAHIDGRLLTPSLADCGIAGTRRRLVIEQLAPALGLSVAECELAPEQLLLADELFYCNALRGLVPVARLANRHWQDHPLHRALHRQFLRSLSL